jgi:glutaredoxin-like protein NrdH
VKVTLYSLPNEVCHQCRFTKKKFDDLGIRYTEIRADLDAEVLRVLKVELLSDPEARLAMPVVRVDLGDRATWTWQGFQPSQIERLMNVIA